MENTQDTRPVVLVVDDVAINIMIVRGALKQEWRLLTAEGGKQALELARGSVRPDLILLDVMMPGMDGHEVCRQLKADPDTRDIPVIFVTAMGDTDSEEQGLQLGAIDYISKPLKPEILRVRVRNHLQLKLYQSALEEARRRAAQDLEAAAEIQRALLPPDPAAFSPLVAESEVEPAARFYWICSPCEQVGGDLLSIVPWDQEYTLFYLLDVAGHGPRAAMITFAVAQFLQPLGHNRDALPFLEPEAMLQELEQAFPMERFESFFTMVYGVFHHPSRTISFCNAGQPHPLLFDGDQPPRPLANGNGSLVGMDMNRDIVTESFVLTARQRLLFYTDGLIDLLNPTGERFWQTVWPRRQHELVAAGSAASLVEECNSMIDEFRQGTPLPDDLTILAISGS
ncbi:MAG: SpoIIE family protein phosphatase [Desulfurivibrio sp.]|nr:SpoIIE family protein phosphatase [Desulfurivibrio sp.]